MGLGQGHGAEEAALDHRLQKAPLLLFGAEVFNEIRRAHGQERVRRRRGIGGLEMGKAGLRQQRRQLHAAGLEIPGGVEKTGLEKGVHGRFHFRNQHRCAVLVARFVLVVFAVVGREVFLRDVARRADRCIEGFPAVLGETFALGQRLGVQHFIQLESQIAGTEQRLGHGGVPFLRMPSSLGGRGGGEQDD